MTTETPLLPLPGLIQEIALVAGLDAALAIAKARGGTRAHFARKPKPENWLSDLVGHDTALKIGAALCGSNASIELAVPLTGNQLARIEMWRLILRMIEDEHSDAAIARATGYDYKSIQRIRLGKKKTIRAAVAADARQPKLFGF